MRIGVVSERSSVPTKTIRYYEEVGLLDQPRRTSSGYRDYEADVLDRLRFIRAAQSLGLKLGEIREVLKLRNRGVAPCDHVAKLIEERRSEIDAQIDDLERMRGELDRIVRRARRLRPKDCKADDICHIIER